MPPLIEHPLSPDAARKSSTRKPSFAAKEMISTAASRAKSPLSFVDEPLAEQQTLTAVEYFARKYRRCFHRERGRFQKAIFRHNLIRSKTNSEENPNIKK